MLETIYEQDFMSCSYGLRPKRGAHDAIRDLKGVADRGSANYIVEADIVSFFDSIDRKKLMEMLRERIADETSLQRLLAAVTRAWRTWLDRRSQRARMTWKRFKQLSAAHPLPRPTIRVRIWA